MPEVVVFDANVLFSAVGWRGKRYRCVELARSCQIKAKREDIRRSVTRGQQCGKRGKDTAKEFGLESTWRSRGRPRKNASCNGSARPSIQRALFHCPNTRRVRERGLEPPRPCGH
jgi:hypothetical protein